MKLLYLILILFEQDTQKHALCAWRRYEANMRFHASQRPGLNQEEDEDEGQEGEEAKEQPESVDISHIPLQEREYRVESSGARVTLASAKPLLYMFCAKMPADR